MKLSDILKDNLNNHGFREDYAIVPVHVEIPDFKVYYVCSLGGVLFDHLHAGIIYTEILEPSAAISAEDILKIETFLQPEFLCCDCKKQGLGLCKPPNEQLLA